MLQHQHFVRGGKRYRTAGTALADDHRYDGHAHGETAARRARDGFGLAPFLCADAWISPRRVDESDDRQLKAIRHLHEPDRFAISLRPRHTEIVLDAGLG